MKNQSMSGKGAIGVVLCLSLFISLSFSSPVGAQEEPVFVLEEMDQELILGQRAVVGWGHFWSGPTVSAINFGYLAEHGYQKLAVDHDGNGEIEASDIEPLAGKLGSEYMATDPDEGTTDPKLVEGIARYVGEKYPGQFEIKVYESEFRTEYQQVMGEELPEVISSVPIRVFTDPEFKVYEKELRAGEMIWLGLPQQDSPLNHYLAGRSLDVRKTMDGKYPVDFGEPKEKSFQPGKGQIIETVMTDSGGLEYGGATRPVDIIIALSPLEEKTKGDVSNLPDLECSFDCERQTDRICRDYEREEECRQVCEVWDGECLEEKTVCEEGDKVCTDWDTIETLECDATVRNVGGKKSGLNLGKLELGGVEDPFLTTPLEPGQEQRAGSVSFSPGEYEGEDLTCRVDIYDKVKESNEANNETKASN